jgi:hypothetical protein
VLTVLSARACRAVPPDQKQVAAWLVRARLDGPGWPDIELADFADALRPAGLDEVARLVAERRAADDPDSWAAVGIKILREQLAGLLLASGLREWALEYLRDRARVKEFYVRELIGVLISEDSLDEAWATAVAASGHVPHEQWLELIGLREPGHPADVTTSVRVTRRASLGTWTNCGSGNTARRRSSPSWTRHSP